MKKRILVFIVAAVMVFAMAVPAMAGSLSAGEQTLMTSWTAVVNSYRGLIGDDIADQYIGEARSALMNDKVDLSEADATDIINNAIKPADAVAAPSATKQELAAKRDQLLAIVNPIVGKYGMKISVDVEGAYGTKGYAYVSVFGSVIDNRPAVKQTGEASMAGTYGILGLIAVAFIAGVVIMNKKRLNEK